MNDHERQRQRHRDAEKLARKNRSPLPDDHPDEIYRRAKVATQIRAENELQKQLVGREGRGCAVVVKVYKSHATLPDSRDRFN